MSDPETDPYTAYYEFEPVYDARDAERRAETLHELGLAGSPCPERGWGTKVEIRCPECGATGKVVSWDDGANVYACRDCETVFDVGAGSDSAEKRPVAGR